MTIVLNGTTGITTPADSISGNLTFTGTGNRITGDFSNATFADRVLIQTSTVNGNTAVSAIPNGTGTITQFQAYSSSDTANSSRLTLNVDATNQRCTFSSDVLGTGTYLPMVFYTGGSESLRISPTSKAVILAGGSTSANGTGITFPATQSASTDANTLDDYEEGTWTPEFTGGGLSFSYTQQYGIYTKIGRFVFVQCWIRGQASGTTSGGFGLGGLPFASTSANGTYHAVDFGQLYILTFPSGVGNVTGYLSPGAGVLSFEYSVNSAGSAALPASVLGSTNSGFILTVCYQV